MVKPHWWQVLKWIIRNIVPKKIKNFIKAVYTFDYVTILISHGADPNIQDNNGDTALIYGNTK